MQPMRWAWIGAGTLGQKVAREVSASGRHRVVSVYTRTPEKRAAFAKTFDALDAPSAEAAIAAPEVDAVYVVTPHTSHAEYARLAVEMGKPVLCEKPLTTDAASTGAVLRLAEERGVYLAEGMWTWFSPVAHQVKAWLDAGEYGDLQEVYASYHMMSMKYAPRVTDPNLAGGALLDIGVYPLTYLVRLFGLPEKIECQGTLKDGIDTGEEITLTYPGLPSMRISCSITDLRGLEQLRLVGEKAKTSLWFYHHADSVTLKRKGGADAHFQGDGSMLNEFDRVAEEIRAGLRESLLVPHSATLGVMRLMDECRRQMGLVYPFERG